MISIWDVFADHFDKSYLMQEGGEEDEPIKKSKKNTFRKKLMLSEWLKEKPNNFEDWMAQLCPVGQRRLVVAYQKTTRTYDRQGAEKEKFKSRFPGGNGSAVNVHVFTVLDCIYHAESKRYFVLDVIAWNNVSFRQVDLYHRHSWLTLKFEEIFEGKKGKQKKGKVFESIDGKTHQYQFFLTATFKTEELEKNLSIPFYNKTNKQYEGVQLDGILFFHKDAPYVMGINSLVRWLKPFMVQEVLGINVHTSFRPPPTYKGMKHYLLEIDKARKKQKRNNRNPRIVVTC